jgi:protoporphyrinogen oxidase
VLEREPKDPRCVIIGAGPAGLTAAYELCKLGRRAVVFEKDDVVGGIARTMEYKGYRFDIGGHRFFTKVQPVQDLWSEILGSDFLLRGRLSRIYYNDRFFAYPLRIGDALLGLGPIEAMRIFASFLKVRLSPSKTERTFEEWVSNRFGRRLYQIFFETYTEKVWGIPGSEIGADWAAQRIKNLDLISALRDALRIRRPRAAKAVTSLIEQFHYPRLGPGMLWERCRELLSERGIPTFTETPVARLTHRGSRIESVTVRDRDGNEREEMGSSFISSMPLRELIHALYPAAPAEVLAAADRLRYRDFLTVVLIVNKRDLFPDQWIYIHSPEVKVGRIQNFKNWSPEMVPDSSKTALGLEYFLWHSDTLWSETDAVLIAMGRREAAKIGLIAESDVVDGCVVRMPKAYPVYDASYKDALAVVRAYLKKFENLESVGRNGQHRYNNQDHSMVTAMYAVQNIAGDHLDCWDVNVEEEYHEEVGAKTGSGDRWAPRRVSTEPD